MTVDYRILGPVEVVGESGPIRLAAARERALLVRLLIDAGRVVSVDRLIEDVWGEEPPESANVSVRVHVSRLRKALGSPNAIRTEHPGYVLALGEGDTLDAVLFEELVRNGRDALEKGDTDAASRALGEATELWRGNALADVAHLDFARSEAARLEEARLAAIEDRIEADLALGRHQALVGELEALTQTYPLRERLWGQRIVALYRSGRQAEALACYQQLRTTLAEELGIDPSPNLVALEAKVLAQDPELAAPPVVTARPRELPSGVVTFVLTDIEASTRLWDEHPDEMAEGLEQHDQLIARLIGEYDGHLLQSKGEGDSTLSVFRRASEGVGAALALRQALADQRWPGELPIRVRIGVHTGEAHERRGDYFGPAVNRAARIRSLACGGQVLISQATAELVHDRLPKGASLVDLGRHELKGLSRAEQVYELVPEGVEPAGRAAPMPEPTVETVQIPLPMTLGAYGRGIFVGREAELERLHAAWKDVVAGERRTVFVAGEPGIGKTRLAAEFAASAHGEGAAVLYGRLDEEPLLPYRPFAESIRALVTGSSEPQIRTIAGMSAGELSRLVPEIAQRVPELPPPIAGDPEGERYRLFEAVVDLFAVLAQQAPVLLVLDDLHWAEKPTLLMLKHILRAPSLGRFMVLGTYRETELGRAHPLAETLADLRREQAFERVLVKGLPEADVGALIGAWAGATAPEPLTRAVYEETDGNPFFVGEVLRHLADAGIPPAAAEHEIEDFVRRVGIPEGIREVIGRRLARLSAECNEVMRTASVVGREFDLAVLSEATGTAEAALLGLVDEASAARLVAEVPGRVGRFAFVHTLIRETLYQELSAARRAHLHRRVGEAIESLRAADVEPHLAELAHHFVQAVGSGDPGKAIEYSARAGDRAVSLIAYEEAIEHYRRALQTFELKDRGDEAARARLLVALGDAQKKSGDFQSARETLLRAADAARAGNVPEELARAALLRAGELDQQVPLAVLAGGDLSGIAILEEAADALPPTDSPLRAKILSSLVASLYWLDRPRVRQLSDEALRMARATGDAHALAYALTARRWAAWAPERARQRLEEVDEILDAAISSGAKERELETRHWRVMNLLELADLEGFAREIDEFERLTVELRQPRYMRLMTMFSAARAVMRGDFAEGERLALEAREMGRREQDLSADVLYLGQLVVVAWRLQGKLASFIEEIAPVAEQVTIPTARAALSLFLASVGRLDEARSVFERLAAHEFADLTLDMTWNHCLAYLSETCALLEDADRAQRLYGMFLPCDGNVVVSGPPLTECMWPVSYYLGLLAETMGKTETAIGHFEDALHTTNMLEAPPLTATVQVAYGRALLRRGAAGDTERAHELLTTALATAQRLGMPPVAEQARALLRPPVPAALRATGEFVGRREERAHLDSGWDEVRAGGSRTLFLAGEPGIGKTRLAAEFAAAVHAEGALVLYGRSDEETLVPYQPFVEAMRTWASGTPADVLRSVVEPTARELTRLVPELRRRVPDLPEPISGDPDGERYRLFEAFGDLLTSIADTTPIVFVIDDLHWADKPTLLLLKHILRREKLGRVLVIGTYRETELARSHPLSETLADLRRERAFERVVLRGLDESDVGALIGSWAGRDAPEHLTHAVYTDTEGNPFFVVEVLRHLEDAGVVVDDDRTSAAAIEAIGIPEGVREVVGRRLARLSEECNEVLAVASVIGREFSADIVDRVATVPSERLLRALEEAISAGLVAEEPGRPGRYAFAHALIRTTLYEELSALRRAGLHRNVGEAIEALHATALEPHLAELAHHFLQAARPGDTAKAIEFSTRAGHRAKELLAYEEAAEHYRRALQAIEAEPSVDEARRCKLLISLGEVWGKGGEGATARESLLKAAEIARTIGSREEMADAALMLVRGWGSGLALIGDTTALALLEEAAGALAADSPLRARLLARLAQAQVMGDQDTMLAYAQEAEAIARRLGDLETLGFVLSGLHYAFWWREQDASRRLAGGNEILWLAAEVGDREREAEARAWRIRDLLVLGESYVALDEEIEAHGRLAKELRQPFYAVSALAHRSVRAVMRGRFSEAEELAGRARALGERLDPTAARLQFAAHMLVPRRMLGRFDENDAENSEAAKVLVHPVVTAARALIETDLGRLNEAKAALEQVVPDGFGPDSVDPMFFLWGPMCAEACAVVGDARRAAILYDLLLPYATLNVVIPVPAGYTWPMTYFLGLLAETTGRLDAAVAHFEDAVAMTRRIDAPAFAPHIQYAHARTLLARAGLGDIDTAHDLLSSALAAAEEFGMPPLIEKVRALLRPPIPAALASPGDTLFVGREPELRRLAAGREEVAVGARLAVLISGEPGIGKTRLAAEFARRAYEDGAIVLYGRSDEDAGIPNQPFVEALSSYVARCELRDLREHVERYGADLARIVPELSRRVPDLPAPVPGDAEFERYRVFEAVTGLLAGASKHAPIVLVLDDLHWATRPTLLLLKHILRSDASLRLLVVGTYRETDLDRSHPLAETLSDLRRDQAAERIPLGGFDEQGVYEFIEAAAGHGLDDVPAARDFARALHVETEGNPFFIREVLNHLAETGQAYQKDGRWTSDLSLDEIGLPQGVREAVARRLSRLSDGANKALAVAAVTGTTFSIDVLERVSEADPSTLLDAIDAARDAGLIVESESPENFRFAHSLVRQTLVAEISSLRRIRLHRKIAEAMEEVYAGDPEPYLPELARHFFEASHGGDVAKAVGYCRRAGEQAMTRVAYEEATEHFSRALEALALIEADEADRADLLLALGEAEARRGDAVAARGWFREAADLARRIDSPERLASAALGFGAGASIGLVPMPPDQELTALIGEALGALGPSDSPLRVRLLARLTNELAEPDNADQLEATSREALEIAERLGDPATQLVALEARLWASMGPGGVEDRLSSADRMLRLAAQVGDGEMVMRGRLIRTRTLFEHMSMDEADQEIQAMAQLAEELRQPMYRWLIVALRAGLTIVDGRFDEGERLAGEAWSLGQRAVGERLAAVATGVLSFLKSFWQGHFQEALSLIRGAMGEMPAWSGSRAAIASIASWAGDLDEARSILEDFASNDFVDVPRDSYWDSTMGSLVSCCANLGDARSVAALYEMLLPSEGRGNVSGGPLILYSGPMDSFIGMAAATMGRWEAAERRFESVLRMPTSQLPRVFPVQVRQSYARMFLTRGGPGDQDRANEQLEKAIALAEELGCDGWAARARAMMRPPLPTPLAGPERGIFVGREQELGRLTDLWAEAQGGSCRAVFVSGEPGIGKTRLAAEFAARAFSDGGTVLYGRADEDTGVPNQPFLEALTPYIARCSSAELRGHVERYGGDLARMIPELKRRLPDITPSEGDETEFERYRVFEALTGLLSTASGRTPIVLVLDDLHWAPKPSLLLLRHLLRSDAPMYLLVIGTYRDTELDRSHPFAEVLADFRKEHIGERVALTGFDEQGVYEYIEAAAGHGLSDVPAARDFARLLHAETEGNPFFIREVLSHMTETGQAYFKEGRWRSDVSLEELGLPQGVREAVSRRLSRLSEFSNKALSVAAVIGSTFSVDLLERIPEAEPTTLLDALDEAHTSGLVRDTEKPGHYEFAHSLVRQTLMSEISSIRRVRLHQRIAETMEDLYARDLEPHVAELARHYLEAAVAGDPSKAIEFSRRAGDLAMSRMAYEEAAGHYERALQAVEPDRSAETTSARYALLSSLGDAKSRAGEVAAREPLLAAAEIARSIESSEHLAKIALLMARTWDYSTGPFSDTETKELLEEAAASLPADAPLRARVLARLSQAYVRLPETGTAMWEEAKQIAQSAGDSAALAFVTTVGEVAFYSDPGGAEVLNQNDELLRMAVAADDLEQEYKVRTLRMHTHLVTGQTELLDAEIDRIAELGELLRQPPIMRDVALFRAMRAFVVGSFEDGERFARDALALGERFDPLGAPFYFAAQTFVPLRVLGRAEEALVYADRNIEAFPWAVVPRAVLCLELGRLDEARTSYDRSMMDDVANALGELNLFRSLLAEACHAFRDTERAGNLYEQLRRGAGTNVVVPPGQALWWPVTYYLGLLAETMGNRDLAVEHFDDALAMTRKEQSSPLAAYVEYASARVLLARKAPGDATRAQELLRDAEEIAERLGMVPLLEKVRQIST